MDAAKVDVTESKTEMSEPKFVGVPSHLALPDSSTPSSSEDGGRGQEEDGENQRPHRVEAKAIRPACHGLTPSRRRETQWAQCLDLGERHSTSSPCCWLGLRQANLRHRLRALASSA